MRKIIALFSLSLLFSACENPVVPFDSETYALDFGPGDNRVLLREYTATGFGQTNRVHGLQKIEFEKDTIFNGSAGRIIAITSWEIFADSIYEVHGRKLIVQEGDSLHEYAFRDGWTPFLVGLLKGSAADTITFSDRILHGLFPLTTGEEWTIRPENDPWGNMALGKEFLGKEKVSFNGKKYECGVFLLHGVEDVPIKTWVSRIGVLRAEIDYGPALMHMPDSSGPYYTGSAAESFKLLRLNATDAEIEALKLTYKSKSNVSAGFPCESSCRFGP